VASQHHKSDLIAWARKVHEVAGAEPSEQQVDALAHTAMTQIARTVIVRFANDNGLGTAQRFAGLGPSEQLDQLDAIIKEISTSYAGKALAQSDEPSSMANSYYNEAHNTLVGGIQAWKDQNTLRLANDVRTQAGLPGEVSAADAAKITAGGGCAIATAAVLVAAVAICTLVRPTAG
jgi:hypothetical protein